jgi:hypothetical protein
MKKPFLILCFVVPVVSSCSRLPGFSDCDKAVDINLLQSVFEKNLRELEPIHPFQLGFCLLRDMKPRFCDIKIDVSDVRKISKSSFSTSCQASVRYSATLRLGDYQKERQRLIAEVNAKASKDLAQSKLYVIKTFENFGVSYSDADLQEGIAKREAAVRKEQEADLIRFTDKSNFYSMLNEPEKNSYFLVADVSYTVAKSEEFLNLNLVNLTLVAKGE